MLSQDPNVEPVSKLEIQCAIHGIPLGRQKAMFRSSMSVVKAMPQAHTGASNSATQISPNQTSETMSNVEVTLSVTQTEQYPSQKTETQLQSLQTFLSWTIFASLALTFPSQKKRFSQGISLDSDLKWQRERKRTSKQKFFRTMIFLSIRLRVGFLKKMRESQQTRIQMFRSPLEGEDMAITLF